MHDLYMCFLASFFHFPLYITLETASVVASCQPNITIMLQERYISFT